MSPLVEHIKCHICNHFQLKEDKVDVMLPTFLTTLQDHVQNLEDALESNDTKSLGRLGHALKGALLNLGLDDVAEIAHTIEIEGKAGSDHADFSGLVTRLKEEMGEILLPSQ